MSRLKDFCEAIGAPYEPEWERLVGPTLEKVMDRASWPRTWTTADGRTKSLYRLWVEFNGQAYPTGTWTAAQAEYKWTKEEIALDPPPNRAERKDVFSTFADFVESTGVNIFSQKPPIGNPTHPVEPDG